MVEVGRDMWVRLVSALLQQDVQVALRSTRRETQQPLGSLCQALLLCQPVRWCWPSTTWGWCCLCLVAFLGPEN